MQVEVKDFYKDDLKKISDSCIEKIYQVEMMKETRGDVNGLWNSLSGFIKDQEQLWNVATDNRWFVQLCKSLLWHSAEIKQLKVGRKINNYAIYLKN